MSRAVFYNLAPPTKARSARVINRELAALAREHTPRVGGLCEVIGYGDLEAPPGYRLVRDRSRPGRANLAAMVREDCELRRSWWLDLRETWSRTEAKGTHPARSVLILGIGEVQVLIYHACPKGTDNTYAAQLEGVRRLAQLMSPWKDPAMERHRPLESSLERPRIALADWNRTSRERGPGPRHLASAIGGKVHGGRIDAAVSRQLPPTKAQYVQDAAGVELGTDHAHGALVVHIGEHLRWEAT